MKKIALAVSIVIGLGAVAYAQAGPPPPPPPGGPGHFHARFRGPGMHPWKVVNGAPYSATMTRQMTRTLANGTTISRTTTGQAARDSSGRTYEQQTITGGPFAGSGKAPKNVVFITDPVAGYSYVLNAFNHTAIRFPFHARPANQRSARRMHRRERRMNNQNRTVTDLGTQTDAASGLELQGKQTKRTIPSDAIGNSQPITSVSQIWYSPALQIVVRSTRNDPRFGKTTYALSNISQSEPDPSLFKVPAGYTIKTRHRRGNMRFQKSGTPPQ